jgi:acetyl/propionyl-CoA carboxylase alpha subunit
LFSRILVANRGEIARRVMRTCRALGITTVAVWSDADEDAPHVRDADESVRIGPAPATDSYLDIEAVVQAAIDMGAEAVHPGYGFLAENADFAAACADKGLVFVGPRPETIRLMGDKAAAKRRLAEAGIPVIPGTDGEVGDDDAVAAASEIGTPLLVKAVAGGGGKGMRLVADLADLPEALAAVRREAQAAFGDGRVLLEKLVERPRHVEVQVFGDTHGRAVHLFERECSIQRRHQKIIEEAPAPALDPALRERICSVGRAAAEAIGYAGAGTVEMLLSATTSDFFFLEMNTRLQVEHPVTEAVTGLDLVEWQLLVAAGDPLPLDQDQIETRGHAIEARVYAEDPARDFLPQTGDVVVFAVPERAGVRVDAGVEAGSRVTRFYDPMLAKVVVHAADRRAAQGQLADVLADTTVLGVTTNVDHLAAITAHPAFVAGELTTAFLDEHLPDWQPAPAGPDMLAAGVVALLPLHSPPERSPWTALGPGRLPGTGGWPVTLKPDGDDPHQLTVRRAGTDHLHLRYEGVDHDISVDAVTPLPWPGTAEIALEVDPRVTSRDHLETLVELGFNRLSMGVQDLTPEVQVAITRNQSYEQTAELVRHARDVGFHEGINIDLIYGLPRQKLDTFASNLDAVIGLRPDRVAVYSFAYIPWIRGHQKKLDRDELPSAELKLELYMLAMERFLDAGYQPIGMDHFALPDDELAIAAGEGRRRTRASIRGGLRSPYPGALRDVNKTQLIRNHQSQELNATLHAVGQRRAGHFELRGNRFVG